MELSFYSHYQTLPCSGCFDPLDLVFTELGTNMNEQITPSISRFGRVLPHQSSLGTSVQTAMDEDMMPFTVSIVDTREEFDKAVHIRHSAYARRTPEFAETLKDSEASDTGSTVAIPLAQSELKGSTLGTARNLANQFKPPCIDQLIGPPNWLRPLRSRATTLDTKQKLAEQGVHAWGSDNLVRRERNLTRYFSREYRKLEAGSGVAEVLQQVNDAGVMAEKTAQLLDEHYNESPVLFEAFLERRYMAYTMAWYGDDPASVRASEASLEDAQAAKFKLAVERIGLKGNERILNIGCGFGALETWLFERYPDLEVVSLTPSRVHVEFMNQCMANPAHILPEDRIKMVLNTLEGVTELELGSKPFDMVFAFGVFEHMANLTTAFQRVHDVLRPGGRLFVHLIVSKPAFPEFMNSDNTLIGRYFPGGRVWPYDILPQASGTMQLVNRWYLNGTNYLRTLEEWHRQYWENMDQLYPRVLDVEGVRYWNDYFTFAKTVMFGPLDGEIYGNGHYVFERPLKGTGE